MPLQFLNLSQAHRAPGVRLLHGKLVDVAPDGINFQGYFSFTISKDLVEGEKARSTVRDLRICEELAQNLRSAGFEVGEVARSKPFGGTFRVNTGGFGIAVILSAKRRPALTQCDVLTFTRAKMNNSLNLEAVESQWLQMVEALERIIKKDLQGSALIWNHEEDQSD